MPVSEIKTCPRCGALFECMASRIELCQCAAINLTPASLTHIEEQFEGCLCVDCLRALSAQAPGQDASD